MLVGYLLDCVGPSSFEAFIKTLTFMRSPDPTRVLSPMRTNDLEDRIRTKTSISKAHQQKSDITKGSLEISPLKILNSDDKENVTRSAVKTPVANPTIFKDSPENRSTLKETIKNPKSQEKSSIRKPKQKEYLRDEALTPKRSGDYEMNDHTPNIPKYTPNQKNNMRFRHSTSKSSLTNTRFSVDIKSPKQEAEGTHGTKIIIGATKKASKKAWDSVREFMSPAQNTGTPRHITSRLQLESSVVKEPFNSKYKGPTDLHTQSYRCKRWEDLVPFLQEDGSNRQKLLADKDGRNPLHLLGLNESLPSSPMENAGADIATFLLKQNAVSKLIAEDNNGHFPFQDIVQNWTISEVEVNEEDSGDTDADPNASVDDIEFGNRKQISTTKFVALKTETEKDMNILVQLPNQVAYALYMSSAILDRLEEDTASEEEREYGAFVEDSKSSMQSNYQRRISRQTSSNTLYSNVHDVIQEYVDQFAKIEDIMVNFLYLDDEDRRFVFNCSIVRRAMLKPESLGPWLIQLFNDGKHSKERASEYVCLLSDTVVSNNEMAAKTSKCNTAEEDIYKKFESLDKLMPSMLMLDKGRIEDLASLPLISKGTMD